MVAQKEAARMNENRKSIRRRVLKSATIEFDDRAYSCAVRDMSDTGANLDVPHALAIPHEFKLVTETDQASRRCRVIWRKENRLGVAFAEQVVCQPARRSKSAVI
jgi:UV DNA damage repair endonuclease